MDKLQLGSEESLHLEFKTAVAMKTPDIIARGVVAFLNGSGGTLWVGVAEDGQGRAKAFEPIPEVDAEKLRLQNILVDTVEPSPTLDDEVTISVEEKQGSSGLLHVKVKRGAATRGPFAVLDKGRRGFFKRTGSRVRVMTREELAAGFAHVSEDGTPLAKATRSLEAKLGEWIKSTPAGLRMLVRPVVPTQIKVAEAEMSSLLTNATKTGNRELGWTFASRYNELRPKHPDGWRFGKPTDVQWLELSQGTGALELFVSRDRLHWRGQANELWPFALMELPASVARLAKYLYSAHSVLGPPSQIVLALGVYGIGDCTLRPHSPDSIGFQMPLEDQQTLSALNDRDYFSSTPVVVTWEELNATPDRCAMHLVGQLYRDFGYLEDKLPYEYDPLTGVLAFPR
jgi:hypothetical protein